MNIITKSLDTANSIALALVALPGIVEQSRELLREEHERRQWNLQLSRSLAEREDACAKYDKRISEIEKLNQDATNQFAAKVRELESERNCEAMARSSEAADAQRVVFLKDKRIAELESELATLRGKVEPSIPEPECGDGWEFCAKDNATEAIYLDDDDEWVAWSPLDGYAFDSSPHHYRFRRPIAKPEPQWAACTAEEARANPGESETLRNGTWCRCDEYCHDFVPGCAYRTRTELPEWVEVTMSVFGVICMRADSHKIEKSGSCYRLKRPTVPVGTVLG